MVHHPITSGRKRLSGGFTLSEITVVIAIMAILMALAASSLKGMMDTLRMKEGIFTIRSVMERARQLAITLNRDVTLRIYRLPDDGGGEAWRSFEYGVEKLVTDPDDREYKDPTTPGFRPRFVPSAPAERLPAGLIIHPSTTFSLLVDGTRSELEKGEDTGPGGVSRSYTSFKFTPEGRCNLPIARSWTLTIVPDKTDVQTATLPPNYAVLQLDPSTADVRVYRP